MNSGTLPHMSMASSAPVSGSQVISPSGVIRTGSAEMDSGSFEGLIEQFTESRGGAEISPEQLEALRSTLEEVDDSEVLGFLAMMQTQASWTPETQNTQMGMNPFAPAETVKQAEFSRADLGLAVQEAWGKAKENMIPTGSSTQRAPELASNVVELPVQKNDSLSLLDREQSFSRTLAEQPPLQTKMDNVSLLTKSNELNQQLSTLQSNLLQTTEADAVQSTVSRVTTAVSRTDIATDVRAQMIQQPVTQNHVVNDKPVWADAMGQRLTAMVSEGRNEAQIRLDPPELGALAVRITTHEAGVTVQFNSDQAQVRDLLQSEASRLRAALEQQGMNLVDVNVGSDSGQASDSQSERGFAGYASVDEDLEVLELPVPEQLPTLSNTLINTFA